MISRVGFIGLGTIGKPIAINLARSGFDLIVYDLREEPLKELSALGAKIATSPQDVGNHGEVVVIQVVDDSQVESLMLGEKGVLSRMAAGSVVAIQSTIHPRTMTKMSDAANSFGVGVVDAQVSGGERGAYGQSLSFMVGGEKKHLEKCRPVFEASGKNIFHMGALGMGAATKLAHQIIVIGNLMSAAEGMIFAEKAGIDLDTFAEVVRAGSARSHIADGWLNRYRVAPSSLAETFYKSVIPALDLAHELNISLPLTAVAHQLIHSRMTGDAPSWPTRDNK